MCNHLLRLNFPQTKTKSLRTQRERPKASGPREKMLRSINSLLYNLVGLYHERGACQMHFEIKFSSALRQPFEWYSKRALLETPYHAFGSQRSVRRTRRDQSRRPRARA